MIDFQAHKDKLEKALEVKNALTDKNCVDEIDEKLWWDNVTPALNQISIEAADELQKETGGFYPKSTVLKDKSTGKTIGVKSREELEKVTGKLDPDVLVLEDPIQSFYRFTKK
jgi:hypothetical protein